MVKSIEDDRRQKKMMGERMNEQSMSKCDTSRSCPFFYVSTKGKGNEEMLTAREGLLVVTDPGVDIALEIVRPRTSLAGRVGHGYVSRGSGQEGEKGGRGDEHAACKSSGLHWRQRKR